MKRVAIITYHRALNCGAMLQAWALQTVLTRMGCHVDFPRCNKVGLPCRWEGFKIASGKGFLSRIKTFIGETLIKIGSIGYYDYTRYMYHRFRHKFLRERNCQPQEFDRFYDLIIIGSDQVWHPKISKSDTALFLAENFSRFIPVVTYAASFGDKRLDDCEISRLVSALSRFKAISVREELTAAVLSENGIDSEIVVDPTCLLEAKDYEPLIGPRPIKEPYLFVYAVSLSRFVLESARELANRKGLRLVICGVYVRTSFRAPSECIWGVSPEKMVSLIAHAAVVLASSFHGTALSLIFSRPFLSLRDSKDTHPTRISTLLNGVGLGERVIDPSKSVDEMLDVLNRPIDWTEAQTRISEQRFGSIRFLERALDL